jgi:predicted ATPase/DNA-binding SARP family transcriptional activator
MDTRKALALLAYLAVTGEAQRRESLAALLWPEYDHSHALGALRRTLSSLRSALRPECLEISREMVGIAPEANLVFDLAQFRALVSTAPSRPTQPLDALVQAAGLYRDHFMAGFSLRDSPEFDDWQFFQAEALRQELSGALERLVQGLSTQGDFEASIPYAQRWLSLDNLHEPAHRVLMRLFSWSGRRSMALHQYQECVRILNDELGVPPLEETTQLFEAIRENRLSPPQTRTRAGESQPEISREKGPQTGPEASTEGQFPWVGRENELEALGAAFYAAGPDGYFVVLEGEAGIGKTRLAEEFLEQRRRSGSRIFTARCYEGESHLAYAPFEEGLRRAISQGENGAWWQRLPDETLMEASRLLPELARLRPGLAVPPAVEGPGAQNRFMEALAQVLLAAIAGSQPGVIFIDDLHWADEASLDLLTYLARRSERRPALLLAAWRGEDLPAEHRLRRLLAETQRNGRASSISLNRLSETTVSALLEAIAPARQDQPALQEISRRLYRETEGLPYFIIEYLRLVGKDQFPGDLEDWSMPGSVRDLLRSRLALLSGTALQLSQAAAVIGRAFDFETLRFASGRTEEECITALEELSGRGLIREDPAPAALGADGITWPLYDFSHDKLRLLVYEETSSARRRLLHRRVAEAAANRPRQEIPARSAQIAYHYRQAGSAPEAAHFYCQAGQYAQGLFANAEALAHYANALMLGHPERAWLNENIGELQVLQGDYGEARDSFETALALAPNRAADLARLEHKLGDLHHRLGNWDRAEAHFKSALEASAGEDCPGDQAGIHSDWSRTVLHRGEIDRALELARRALALAEKAGDQGPLARAYNILGIIARNAGSLEEAEYHLERSLQYAQGEGRSQARIAALNNLALVYAARKDYPQAIAAASSAMEACRQYGDRHREAALHNNLADLYHALGETERAMEHLRKAVMIFTEVGEEDGEANPEIWKLMEW